jgi:2',3'-cyclic-nucleotide 2'-phosphodiesterase / 3'-nucleotidase
LAANPQFNPSADGNWSLAAVPGVSMTFVSATAAVKYLANHPKIKLVKDLADGFSLYELVP